MNKVYLYFVFFLLIFVPNVNSQNLQPLFSVGIGNSKLSQSSSIGDMFNYNDNGTTRYSINLGIEYEVVEPRLSVLGEFCYQTKGDANTLKDLDYLSLPLLLRLNFGRDFKIYFGVGMHFSFLLRKSKNDASSLKEPETFNFGSIFNFGIKYSVSDKIGIFADYRYLPGGTPVYKDIERIRPGGPTYYDLKNYSFYISVGVAYKILRSSD